MPKPSDYISTRQATGSKFLAPLNIRTIQRMCEEGLFKTAYRPGMGKKAHWFIHKLEVLRYRNRKHPNPENLYA